MFGSGILKGKKTYVVGVIAIVGFLGGYLVGDVTVAEAAQGIVTTVLAMTVRSGVAAAAAAK